MKNIMVAIDFNENIQQVLNYAKMLAQKFDAKLWVVHIAAPEPDFIGYEIGPQYIRDFRADVLKREHIQLQEINEQLTKEGFNSDAMLIEGPTVKMILDEAKELKIDLIVMGSHDHSFLYNAFIGNTTLELLKKSRIPTLAVPIE